MAWHGKPDNRNTEIVVIVVEDEVLCRSVVAAALDEAGFVVLEANDADQAVRILEAEADRVDALFTDVNLPGSMNGVTLARHTKRHWPWIGLLVASGDINPRRGEMPENSRFLSKPYDLGAVVHEIRELARAA